VESSAGADDSCSSNRCAYDTTNSSAFDRSTRDMLESPSPSIHKTKRARNVLVMRRLLFFRKNLHILLWISRDSKMCTTGKMLWKPSGVVIESVIAMAEAQCMKGQ
jgi:hypothetical protein